MGDEITHWPPPHPWTGAQGSPACKSSAQYRGVPAPTPPGAGTPFPRPYMRARPRAPRTGHVHGTSQPVPLPIAGTRMRACTRERARPSLCHCTLHAHACTLYTHACIRERGRARPPARTFLASLSRSRRRWSASYRSRSAASCSDVMFLDGRRQAGRPNTAAGARSAAVAPCRRQRRTTVCVGGEGVRGAAPTPLAWA